jgi:hypothetical protein
VDRILGRFARSARVLLGRERAGPGVTVWPDDVFLVSYPKSGNTWLRFLVSNLANPQEPTTFSNIEEKVPSIYVNHDRQLRRLSRPRILKSHESFVSRYQKVIYIVRDPRDVCVSYYHYLVKYRVLPQGYPLGQFVPRFIADEFEHYGAWGDHVLSWLAMRGRQSNFLLLRYEDLLDDPEFQLARVAHFLKIHATYGNLVRAVYLSSADRMRYLEKWQSRKWISTKRSRQDMPFVRSATAGEWKSALNEASALQIEKAWGPVMHALGYKVRFLRGTGLNLLPLLGRAAYGQGVRSIPCGPNP